MKMTVAQAEIAQVPMITRIMIMITMMMMMMMMHARC